MISFRFISSNRLWLILLPGYSRILNSSCSLLANKTQILTFFKLCLALKNPNFVGGSDVVALISSFFSVKNDEIRCLKPEKSWNLRYHMPYFHEKSWNQRYHIATPNFCRTKYNLKKAKIWVLFAKRLLLEFEILL